jgi:hypothetical protein
VASRLKLQTTGDGRGLLSVSEALIVEGRVPIVASWQPLVTVAYASSLVLDLSQSNWFQITLAGNPTLSIINSQVGQQFVLRLIQDGSGSRTVTWFGVLKWPSATPPTLTATAGGIDVFTFKCTAANAYDGFVAGQAMG